MKTTANGIAMNYTLEGPATAPVVTMSHSLATDLSMWDPTVPALTGRFRVLFYETGARQDRGPEGAYTLDQLADDALALLKALGIARTHWVGPVDGRHDRPDARAEGARGLREPLALRHVEPDSAEAKPLWQTAS